MPFDISGVFSRLYSWVNDRDTGVKINAPRMDAEFNGVKDAINAIVGQTQPFINPVKAKSGTAAAPSYTFDGDQDTGFYRIGPNQMGLAQGGVGLGQVFARGNILGTVSQSGGVPTGAIIERGSNANGEYVRFASGTQICTRIVTASASAVLSTTFAAPFLGGTLPTIALSLGNSGTFAAMATYSGLTATGVEVSTWNITGGRVGLVVGVTAIGNWF